MLCNSSRVLKVNIIVKEMCISCAVVCVMEYCPEDGGRVFLRNVVTHHYIRRRRNAECYIIWGWETCSKECTQEFHVFATSILRQPGCRTFICMRWSYVVILLFNYSVSFKSVRVKNVKSVYKAWNERLQRNTPSPQRWETCFEMKHFTWLASVNQRLEKRAQRKKKHMLTSVDKILYLRKGNW
jgi:hypothetical protein